MREVPHLPPRIVWWGLVTGLLCIALLGIGEIFYKEYLQSEWNELRRERETALRLTVQQSFLESVRSLRRTTSGMVRDDLLIEDLLSNDPDVVLRGFDRLNDHARSSGHICVVLDPRGTRIAWSGSGAEGGADIPAGDTATVIRSASLRSYLETFLRDPETGLIMAASLPFDIRGDVSERFVSGPTLRHSLEEIVGGAIAILGTGDVPAGPEERRFRIPLVDDTDRIVVTALVDAPTLESEILRLESGVASWMGLFASLVVTILGWLVLRQTLGLRSLIPRLLLSTGLVWLVRYFWLWTAVPSGQIGGWMFDPGIYASLFGNGAASSPGEVSISTLAVLLTVILIRRELRGERPPRIADRRLALGAWMFAGIALGIGLNIVLRAYGATLRSFVYDSTLKFVSPSEILPAAPVAFMHLNVLVLTAALILLFSAVTGYLVSWYRTIRPDPGRFDGLWSFAGIFTVTVILFGLADRVPQVPWFVPFLVFGAGALILTLQQSERAGLAVIAASLVGLSLVISIPVLDGKVHEKEADRLRHYAAKLTQPVDAWLSFVTSESFRTVRDSFSDVLSPAEDADPNPGAFLLWTRTLMSREGYNSAVVLYDGSGKELDRFAVGLTTYEQTELLHRLFDVDEEALNVVERRVPGGLTKYYGMWGSIRDSADRPLAFAALVLSANEQALFRGEAPAPLRPPGTGEIGSLNQTIILSEYQDGRLVTSSDLFLQTGDELHEDVRSTIASGRGEISVREEIHGKSFETLYVRDDSRPGRVIGISVELVGLRWHLFNLVKVAVLYGVVLGIILLWIVGTNWKRYREILTGFRGRLIVAFLFIAIVPLLLIAYYNREFARERQEYRVTAGLLEDLRLISQRIVGTVTDEEDFLRGVNDDFCEATASEFGVDFTVFRREQVLASTRPELYSAGLVGPRLPGDVFARIVVAGFGYAQTRESVGDLTYEVGYVPLLQDGRLLGVLAVPALLRQTEYEAEVAERNAFTMAVYSVLVLLTVALGILLAHQLSQPVRALTRAARDVGAGNLEVSVQHQGSGEVRELVHTFNDMVAELKKSREELRRGERERAWKEMAKQVAHEIKNPLTPMRLSVQHLRTAYKDKAPGFDKLIADVAETIISQIDALSRIATEFSSFARMPERKFERVDIHALLEECVRLFAAVEGIEFRNNLTAGAPVLIADREELRRVVINIIRNAIQAMNQRGTIGLKTSVRGRRCSIEISDTGPGIPEDLQKRVFEPNFSTKTDGMGLGLAMARNIIGDLDGEITLRSKPGSGTTITLTLPVLSAE